MNFTGTFQKLSVTVALIEAGNDPIRMRFNAKSGSVVHGHFPTIVRRIATIKTDRKNENM